jgi:hypothetical protein
MITKPQLREKSHSNIEKYFDSILECQAKGEDPTTLIKILSQRQRNHFSMWLDDYQACKFHHSFVNSVKQILFNL